MKNTKIHLKILFLAGTIISTCFGCKPSSPDRKTEGLNNSALKEVRVIENIPYRSGQSKSWVLDMALPVDDCKGLRPAIVIVHGGGWRAGTKQDFVETCWLLMH
jgi:acetyl esterase/lipase